VEGGGLSPFDKLRAREDPAFDSPGQVRAGLSDMNANSGSWGGRSGDRPSGDRGFWGTPTQPLRPAQDRRRCYSELRKERYSIERRLAAFGPLRGTQQREFRKFWLISDFQDLRSVLFFSEQALFLFRQ
jgi:hypothetical protein